MIIFFNWFILVFLSCKIIFILHMKGNFKFGIRRSSPSSNEFKKKNFVLCFFSIAIKKLSDSSPPNSMVIPGRFIRLSVLLHQKYKLSFYMIKKTI